MDRAFSPFELLRTKTWAAGPGWFKAAPLALRKMVNGPFDSNVGTITEVHAPPFQGQRPVSYQPGPTAQDKWPDKSPRAESPAHHFARAVMRRSTRPRRPGRDTRIRVRQELWKPAPFPSQTFVASMDRAFSPFDHLRTKPWAAGPGWFKAAPLALRLMANGPFDSNVGTIAEVHASPFQGQRPAPYQPGPAAQDKCPDKFPRAESPFHHFAC